MDVTHEERSTGGSFALSQEGKAVGEMFYRDSDPETITITHTEVATEMRGQGAGLSLVEAGVAWARAKGKKVVAQCPFAHAIFEKHPELRDVLVPPVRS